MPEYITKPTNDPTINLALDTLKKKKQAIVFANTKASAEKTAEEIGKCIKHVCCVQLKEKVLKVLSRPTKQCERLSRCIEKGIAFHHAGLASQQRQLIEDNFREGNIKIICSTPTLAMGLDLPAFRVILKDLRRYTRHGLDWIPVLEYNQMSGRAGRPKFDKTGEAIAVSKTEAERDEIWDRYVNGEVEDIYSKLAVEPVLRTYVLSLIATGFVRSKKQLIDFFSKTFWSYQFADMTRIEGIIEKVLGMLSEFEFLEIESEKTDFVSADEIGTEVTRATLLGKRVAQLYIDPLTANKLINCLRKSVEIGPHPFSFLHMVSYTFEMRPLLKVRSKELEDINEYMIKYDDYLLENPPNLYDAEYDEFLHSIKTAKCFMDWIDENDEEFLLDQYKIRPGELRVKLENADWLLYASEEIAKILKMQKILKEISKLRYRLKYGVKEELLALLQLKQIGRARARRLWLNKIKSLGDLKKVDINILAKLIGRATSEYVKEQLGQKVDKVKENKRKGQISLKDY